MALTPGSRLGPYEIVSRIGAGGMGEVFRARDTRLERAVAIKVLPAEVAGNAKLKIRFEREARTIAQLSHPNICTLHDVGDGYLVMELLDGQSLADRLARGPLPLTSLLRYGAQIADALDRAHRAGIIHRDLKPSNIMITKSGAKLLDFGLAKPHSGVQADSTLTQEGAIVGTLKYMAPEQLDGKEADPRTDIFAFGAVVYEMATGKRAFEGSSATSVIDAIINRTPQAIAELQPLTPPTLDHIVSRCLEKDPDERWQCAHDIGEQLRWLARSQPEPAVAATKRRPWIAALGVAGILLGAGTTMLVTRHGVAQPPAQHTRKFTQLTFKTRLQRNPSLAPDGQTFIFISQDAAHSNIYLQRVDGQNAINLTKDSTFDNVDCAFSPDGEHIAYASYSGGGGIFVMGATGEALRRLTTFGFDPAWSPDGKQIVFSTGVTVLEPHLWGGGALWIVDVESGKAHRVAAHLAAKPNWSPHGYRIAFWAHDRGRDQRDVFTIDPAAPDPDRTVIPVTLDAPLDWNPVWSPDGAYLYFSSDRDGTMNVWRVRIDEKSGVTTGPLEPMNLPANYAANVTFDRSGDMAYASIEKTTTIERYPFDASTAAIAGVGSVVYRGTQPIAPGAFAVSPDGKNFVIGSAGKLRGLIVMSSDGATLRQITTVPEGGPSWSEDGEHIYYHSARSGNVAIWSIHPDGSDAVQLTTGRWMSFPKASHDGKKLLAECQEGTCLWDLEHRSEQALPKIDNVHMFAFASWSRDEQFAVGQRLRTDDKQPDVDGIAVYSFATKTYTVIPDDNLAYVDPHFLPDGKSVVYATNHELVAVNLATRATRVILPDIPDRSVVAISRDGRSLYVERPHIKGDIWLMTQR